MDLGLTGKVAFVAGSSRGIGLGVARSFLEEGARAVLTGRDPHDLQSACASVRGGREDCGDEIQWARSNRAFVERYLN